MTDSEQIILLGSTGSVGSNAIGVIRRAGARFTVAGLAAGRATDAFIEQIDEFRPRAVAVRDEIEAKRITDSPQYSSWNGRIEILHGPDGLSQIASMPGAEKVLNALSGAAGIRPSLAAVRAGRQLLIANKEALVSAGELIMSEARARGVDIVPVDSEHSAIFQCLRGEGGAVRRLLLTASGGPFLNRERLDDITPAMALNHPTWSMGPKITIDSATMMNKGLEIIEAARLFDVPVDKIQVVIHPECVVHSMVEFADGVVKAQMSPPDMAFPIQYALHYPERGADMGVRSIDFAELQRLTFHEPDAARFPCLRLAVEAAARGALIPAALVAADEVAVEAFLSGRAGFTAIPYIIESALNRAVDRGMHRERVDLDSIMEADAAARRDALDAVERSSRSVFGTKTKTETETEKDPQRPLFPERGVSEPLPESFDISKLDSKKQDGKKALRVMNYKEKLEFLKGDPSRLPKHVAIIMDGNGRWAKRRGLPRTAGHKAGADRVKPIMNCCMKLGIPVLTVFAFSTENWDRPEHEVNTIMNLLASFIERETANLRKHRVRIRFPGGKERLPDALREKMAFAEAETSHEFDFTLNICINYGGRSEIVKAVRKMMANETEAPDESTISRYLDTSGLPDPDIVIRTGGDNRISNFLLWQIAYAEIFFHQKYWPEFRSEDLADCLIEFAGRERRFGKIQDSSARLLDGIDSPAALRGLTPPQLERLAAEMRETIIECVSEHGGHLASNLGIVELAIAIHRVFDSPTDKIVWDVGHQCYPHKLLTGRHREFYNLRTRDGLSGFPNTEESPHDCFNTGHGSTSISAAAGIAAGRALTGADFHVIAVCGDGAITGGMAFEALNHAGDAGNGMIVILNDNTYSISPVTGAMSRSLSRIRTNAAYVRLHQRARALKSEKHGFFGALSVVTKPFRYLAKYFAFRKGILFEELGFKYIGPVDGHDVKELLSVLEKIRNIREPVLLHVLTKKGKGYNPAELNPPAYHGVEHLSPPDEVTPEIRPGVPFTKAFSDALEKLCETDERIVGITAAMPSGTGLDSLMKKFPGRFFDVGMAEQHAVTFAAGLATQGLRPVVAIYSTFLQRAYDQIFHDVCLQNLPVVFAIDRAGLVSGYGRTHQGIMDISYLRHLPNVELLAPRDTVELALMLEYAIRRGCPVAIRYPSDTDTGALKAGARPPVETAVSETLCEGRDAVMWAVGPLAGSALKAAKILSRAGVSVKVVNVRFVHPFDENALLRAHADGVRLHFTVEDNLLAGGFGGLFLETANRLGLENHRVVRLGVEHNMIPNDTRRALLNDFGLTCDSIAERALREIRGAAKPDEKAER